MSQLHSSDLAVLAVLDRDGQNESFHHGIAVLVSPDGRLLSSAGNELAPIYPRSALKPLQALAMRDLGLRPTAEQAVMTMASHHGTSRHIALIRELLAANGLSESELQCPADLPWNTEARVVATQSAINMNCSGKHAGFLAASKINGQSLDSYLSPSHPVQLHAQHLIEKLAGETISKVAIDGCGAPLYSLSTIGLARAISGFVQQAPDLVSAAIDNPMLIGDDKTPDAVFLKAGFFSKLGAEGVFTVGTPDGYALAIKIADGSLRAAPEIAIRLLNSHGLISKEQTKLILDSLEVFAFGGGKVVGSLDVKL